MVNLKKCVSLFLVLFLLIGNSFVLAEEAKTEITFENSLYVEAYSQTQLTFTPEDFPGVDCSRVIILYKEAYEDSYGSSVLLVLNQSGKQAKAQAMEKLKQFSFVTSVDENKYAELQVTMDTTSVTLKKGESITVEYSAGGSAELCNYLLFGTFEVDPTVFDESNLTQDTFAHLGITKYWPLVSDSNTAMWNSETDLFPSPRHRYCTKLYFGNKGNGIEIADNLARTPGITMVDFFGQEADGSYLYQIVNDAPDVFDLYNPWNPQKVTLTGKTSGQGTFSLITYENTLATCNVTVYELGNVNEDTNIDAKDALAALQYTVQKRQFESWQVLAAEVTGDDKIDAKDALEILKYSVKKITKFPIEEIVITPTDVTPTNQ